MSDREFLLVDPADLHLPAGRNDGVDPVKLHRQMSEFGIPGPDLPALEVSRGSDGAFVINDGVTQATRVAKYLPGTRVVVEVIGTIPVAVGGLPTVRERL